MGIKQRQIGRQGVGKKLTKSFFTNNGWQDIGIKSLVEKVSNAEVAFSGSEFGSPKPSEIVSAIFYTVDAYVDVEAEEADDWNGLMRFRETREGGFQVEETVQFGFGSGARTAVYSSQFVDLSGLISQVGDFSSRTVSFGCKVQGEGNIGFASTRFGINSCGLLIKTTL